MFAREYRERDAALQRERERLDADRAAAIGAAYANGQGMAMAAIAAVLEMSHQRVSQILRGS